MADYLSAWKVSTMNARLIKFQMSINNTFFFRSVRLKVWHNVGPFEGLAQCLI